MSPAPADRPPVAPIAPIASIAPQSPWWQAWLPAALPVSPLERLRAVAGVALGLFVAATLAWALRSGPGSLWLMAPLGASAVLVFVMPASPLAQPWAVVGGNTLAAGVAVLLNAWVPWPLPVLAPLATALAVALMMATRSLHPPGGAVALLAVLGGASSWQFAFFPVFVNSLALVLVALAFHPLTGKRYPHPQQAAATPAPVPGPQAVPPRFTDADLDAVLARRNEVLDVPRDELVSLLADAEVSAHARRLAQWRCEAVMSPPTWTLKLGSTVAQATALLQAHDIKALPVVDASQHVVGIVTRLDLARADSLDATVAKVMTRRVRVISADRSLADVVPIFVSHKHHHLPVVDAQLRLVGVITQTDVLRALLKAD